MGVGHRSVALRLAPLLGGLPRAAHRGKEKTRMLMPAPPLLQIIKRRLRQRDHPADGPGGPEADSDAGAAPQRSGGVKEPGATESILAAFAFPDVQAQTGAPDVPHFHMKALIPIRFRTEVI